MAGEKKALDELGEELKQMRDEIELQIHLASANARDEFGELEKKWEHFRARLDVLGKATEEAAEDVGDALISWAASSGRATRRSARCPERAAVRSRAGPCAARRARCAAAA